MLRAIQPRAVRLDCIEEQNDLRAIPVRVRNDRDWVARFVRHPSPSPADHDADARRLDIPRSHRGGVCSVAPNRDDNLAVRVLPPILLYDASIRNIPGHIEHRARMMSERRNGCSQHDGGRDNQARNSLLHPDSSFPSLGAGWAVFSTEDGRNSGELWQVLQYAILAFPASRLRHQVGHSRSRGMER